MHFNYTFISGSIENIEHKNPISIMATLIKDLYFETIASDFLNHFGILKDITPLVS